LNADILERMAARTRAVLAGAAASLAAAALTGCSISAPATLPSPTPSPSATVEDQLLSTEPATSTVGDLAPDFPADLLPVPPDAKVLVSTAVPAESGLWDVSLNVVTEQDANGLLDAVRGPLVAAGFVEQPEPPADGLVAQAAFSRADGELIIVGIRDDGATRTLTAGGTVSLPEGDGQ
jgi:hypothetical protein